MPAVSTDTVIVVDAPAANVPDFGLSSNQPTPARLSERAAFNRPPVTVRPLHAGKTSMQTQIKLSRQMGKSEFPKIHLVASGSGESTLDGVEVKAVRDDGREASASADIAAGTPIAPEPGTEVDLGPAFRRIAAELCAGFGAKTHIKYTISIRESVQGQTIPVNMPQMTANLWPEGLEDLPFS